ncbi:hypothetical protein PCASD_12502 [Puccinia coronata f. sp. avenae]|uniref:Uncharacterized protein n=1 Tax=Puccinia coronata f. sp. avenae TaxID=200324 RepID=A0A2N5U7K5_9BASI|nr:hypothetical protein PCASD_12502 [Puccinia coronata f. sp. avenae]
MCNSLQRGKRNQRQKYQPDELVDLLAGLVQVSARARRSNCLLGWYRYQLGKPVDLLAELVTVPGQRAGHGGVNTTMTVIEVSTPPWPVMEVSTPQ